MLQLSSKHFLGCSKHPSQSRISYILSRNEKIGQLTKFFHFIYREGAKKVALLLLPAAASALNCRPQSSRSPALLFNGIVCKKPHVFSLSLSLSLSSCLRPLSNSYTRNAVRLNSFFPSYYKGPKSISIAITNDTKSIKFVDDIPFLTLGKLQNIRSKYHHRRCDHRFSTDCPAIPVFLLHVGRIPSLAPP